MRRKFNAEMEIPNQKWGVIQENTRDIKANEINVEKNIVKEGTCEECGVFDVLSKFNDKFFCSECIKLLSSKPKNYRKLKHLST